jgi:hypothetical protein
MTILVQIDNKTHEATPAEKEEIDLVQNDAPPLTS